MVEQNQKIQTTKSFRLCIMNKFFYSFFYSNDSVFLFVNYEYCYAWRELVHEHVVAVKDTWGLKKGHRS